jgi:hypothetical protein
MQITRVCAALARHATSSLGLALHGGGCRMSPADPVHMPAPATRPTAVTPGRRDPPARESGGCHASRRVIRRAAASSVAAVQVMMTSMDTAGENRPFWGWRAIT